MGGVATSNVPLFAIIIFLIPICSVKALNCYKHNTIGQNLSPNAFQSSATVGIGCAACKKTVQKNNVSGLITESHQWQCDTASSPTPLGECKESIYVQYFSGGTFDSHICTCCTDKCNDVNFCSDNNTLIIQMQNTIEGKKEGPASFPCYEGIIQSGPEGSGMVSFEMSTQMKTGCKECKRTVTSQAVPALGKLLKEEWSCVTGESASTPCKPYMTGTIFLDGTSNMTQCVCCNYLCNEEKFCDLSSAPNIPLPVMVAPTTPLPPKNDTSSSATPAKTSSATSAFRGTLPMTIALCTIYLA